MAQDFVSYVKALWKKATDSDDRKAKEEGLRELEAFLKEQNAADALQKPVLPDAPTYDRVQYDAPDDAQLTENAEQSLSGYRKQQTEAIERELAALQKQYETGKADAEQAHKQKQEATDAAYDGARKNSDADLIKRGIARSSIAANVTGEIERERAAAQSAAAAAYRDEVLRLDGELKGLESKRQQAMSDFDLTYAAKLSESIQKLKEERDKKQQEALRYNNSLTEKEHAAQVDKTMKESDLYSELLAQKKKEKEWLGDDVKYETTYRKMAEVLRAMNPLDAQAAIVENALFRDNLNDRYYYLLYNEFAR